MDRVRKQRRMGASTRLQLPLEPKRGANERLKAQNGSAWRSVAAGEVIVLESSDDAEGFSF